MSEWTQEKFDEDHAEPRDYGEGDVYVVAGNLTDEEAAAKITEWERDLTGEDTPPYNAADISSMPIGVGINEDGDEDWVLNPKDDKVVAWGQGIYI